MQDAYRQLQSWLLEMSSGTTLKPVLTEDGYCRLTHGNGDLLTVIGLPGSDVFYVMAEVIPLPIEGHLELFRKCLTLNLDQGNLGGASLSVDEDNQAIVLSFVREVFETNFTQFNNTIQNMVNLVERMQLELLQENEESRQVQRVQAEINQTMISV